MPADNFARCVAFTLAAEGGFVDDPEDPGGATNYGVTLQTLSAYRRRVCTVADVRALTLQEASDIYRAAYWMDGLPIGVDLMAFDFGVNAGTHESVTVLQFALGFTGADVDGDLGPITKSAAAAVNAKTLIATIESLQARFYMGLPDFPAFGDGWLARTKRRESAALAMLT
jgi:lysozyme family protein